MEFKRLLSLVRRWAWLLVLGLVVGLLTGYFASRSQEPIYEASSKLLVSSELQGQDPAFAGLSNQQVVQTYVQMLKTKHLRDATSERLGINISSGQVSVKQVPETQIIEISAEHPDPEQVALIANTIVLILTEENKEMQVGQFLELEESLSGQLDQVKKQIATTQAQYDQVIEEDYKAQLAQVDEQIAAIQVEISTLQPEIAALTNVASVEGRAKLGEKQLRVSQLQSNIKIYEDLRANLLVLQKPITTGNKGEDNPRLNQLRSTIDLYQKIYIDILSKLESTRLARLQQTSSVVQIEKAFVPSEPIRPIPMVYALLSGIVGLVLAGAVVAFLEMFGEDLGLPKRPVVPKPGKPIKGEVMFE
jgi:uncharacterized protein involved in exopolysaccharide biosynthesis